MGSSNNVFVEIFFGYNEPMSTRVHNNAGSGGILKEVIQVNFDEEDDEETLFIFVRNQKVMGTQELARAEITTEALKKMIKENRGLDMRWDEGSFKQPISLIPRGRLWLKALPFHEE